MANYKVPSQAASGADSFSDGLVGNQITNGVNQMTGTNFAIEKTIPEKDSKEFKTQPFSEFLTLDDIVDESATKSTSSSSLNNDTVRFNNNKESGNRSLYGSLKQRIGVAVTNIISKYPAAVLVDVSSPIGLNNNSAESSVYTALSNTTEFKVQYSLLYNPLGVVLIEPKSNTLPETDNDIRNFFSSYTKYVIDLSGSTYNILSYTEPDSNNQITLKIDGDCFNGSTGFTENYLIRPNNGIVEGFYTELDDLEQVLVNRVSNPKFNAGFNVPRDTNGGYTTETITVYVNWPVSRDGWNIQILGLDYGYYVNQLSSIADEIDDFKSNLIVRFLTSPQLYEFDTEEKKIESIFQIYGQSFDQIKVFIDNIAYMRNVSYDGINNIPDTLLKNLSETLGLSTINLFDERSLEESLYTRHDVQYNGISNGVNLIEAEYEFYRRLVINLAYLYKSKGTRKAIEFFLKFIGAPEPMIRLDEYVYKVDNVLPSKDVEGDIRETIQGTKIFNVVEFDYDIVSTINNHTDYDSQSTGFKFFHVTGGTITDPTTYPLLGTLYERYGAIGNWSAMAYTGTTGYTLTQLTGSTSLTREEYPVDEETGLPRKATSSDGTMYFQKGAGWYKSTLNHRSPDILDEENSDLTSRIKVIKTMAKPFTYGEDYFDVFRQLSGLDYGYSLSSEIDNKKIEVVNNEYDHHLILNRKNINVFLSADRTIDYDIYRKARDLSLNFGVTGSTLMPPTGVTFAEFIDEIISKIVINSHVIKYKNSYSDLSQLYNRYQQSNGFTPYHYISVEEFINRLSPYWVNIIEQFIPATTLWLGGNVIENGIFNRSKFKHRRPALPVSYNEILYPDFETVIYEDLETIIGGGTMSGIDYSLVNFRGVQLFSGVTFDMFLNINGIIYSGTTTTLNPDPLKPFSGCTSLPNFCTIIPSSSEYIPLICGFELFNGGDSIDDIKTVWKNTLNGIISQINSYNTGKTGFTITAEYYLDENDIDMVKFTILSHDFYGYTGNETFDYYFRPFYVTEKQDCSLVITPSIVGADLVFDVSSAVGTPNGPIEGYIGPTISTIDHIPNFRTGPGDCRYGLPVAGLSPAFIMMFNDGGNCEIKMSFIGTTGQGEQTFNYGLKKGTVVYKLFSGSTPTTYQELQTAIINGGVIEVLIENVIVGDELLSLQLKSCDVLTSQQFQNVPINYQFAFDYTTITIQGIDCLSSSKTNIINGTFEVLPTSQVLVYSKINLNLEEVPYNFTYKYPEDVYVKPNDNQNGDFLIDLYGFPIEVTGTTLDYCRTDVYFQLYINPMTSDTIILFNGNVSENNGIIISYPDAIIVPTPTPTPTSTVTPTVTPNETPAPTITPSETPTPTITPSITITPTVTPTVTPTITPSPSIPSANFILDPQYGFNFQSVTGAGIPLFSYPVTLQNTALPYIGTISAQTLTIIIGGATTGSYKIDINVNGSPYSCQNIGGAGTFYQNMPTINVPDELAIRIDSGSC